MWLIGWPIPLWTKSCFNLVNHFAQTLRAKGPLSGRFQPQPRTKKAPPRAEFGNPTDLVDKFTFFGLAMLLVPQNAIFRNPMRVPSLRNGSCCRILELDHYC